MFSDEHDQLVQLREKIAQHFGDGELHTPCFNLGLDHHDLPGEGRADKIRELVVYCQRHGSILELVKQCKKQFPQEDWSVADTVHLFVNVPPLPAHELVGRDELLAELREKLMRGGELAITALNGLPGVGKTTLAVMLAHNEQVRAHFSGGILWAGLGPNPSVDAVLNQWADALGMSLSGIADTADRARAVQAAIARRAPMLLVIDDVWNIEHANALNLACKGCAVLLTTRDEVIARRLASQQTARVEELPEDEAVKLLMNVGQVDNLSYADLARLARAVGGLPLALMLVGGYLLERVTFAAEARQAMTALGQTETWLGLVDTSRRLSLQDVIALSLDALPDDARAAFAGLAAFAPKPADFSEEAALAVTGAQVGVLGKLVKRNLLEKVAPERATLHPALAAVAERRAGERLPELRLAHAQYYLDWVNHDRNGWRRIEPELEQIRFAWEHLPPLISGEGRGGGQSLVLDYVWAMRVFQNMRGLWREKIDWCERGLACARAMGKREDQGILLNDIGARYDSLGNRRRALEYYEQALPIHREVGNRAVEATTLNNIGMVYDALGERRRALEYYEQALSIVRDVGDRAVDATTLHNIGAVYDHLGDRHRALEYFEQALPIHREVGNRAAEAITLNNIGAVYDHLGDRHCALEYFEQALPISREVGDHAMEATTLNNIGGVYNNLGDRRRALEYYEQALSILRDVGDRAGEATTLNNIGGVYDNLGDRRRALKYYEQALPIRREVGDRAGEAVTLNNIGAVYDNLGDRRRALEHYEQALPIHREVGNRAEEATTLNNIGRVYRALGDNRRALDYYEQALPIRRDVGDRVGEATTLNNIGLVYDNLGDRRCALDYYEQALLIRREVGDRAGESVTLFNIAMIRQAEGNYAEAVRFLEQVVAIDDAIEHPDLESDRAALEEARQKLGNATPDDESSD